MRRASTSSSPSAASFCASCPTRSHGPRAISKSTGSKSNSFTRAAAARPCRPSSAARSITPRPRSTWRSQAYARGADIRRFATTGRLPLFALVTAPKKAEQILGAKDLEGKVVGVSALGNADHALVLTVLRQAGADPKKVQFATLGPNLLEALRQGQVDAGAVQEPALTLLEKDGARVIVNGMDLADARKHFGGPYEFMGVAVRTKEIATRKDEMVRLGQALEDALKHLQAMTADELVAALPREVVAGSDMKQLGEIIARHRSALYPTEVAIDLDASKRVAESLKTGGLLKPDADVSGLFDTSIVRG